MIAGLVLILASGLAAVSIYTSLSDRVDVLVAARPIAKGQIIAPEDLRTVSIAAGEGVRAMSPDQQADLVGTTATGPIGAGSIVHPSQFSAEATEDQQRVIVGAALQAGEYPRAALLPGDEVMLIEVSGPTASLDDNSGGPREITVGEIVETSRLVQSDVLLVSMRVTESVAILVAERAEQGRLRLALIDNGFRDDLVEPLEPAAPVEPAEPEAPDS